MTGRHCPQDLASQPFAVLDGHTNNTKRCLPTKCNFVRLRALPLLGLVFLAWTTVMNVLITDACHWHNVLKLVDRRSGSPSLHQRSRAGVHQPAAGNIALSRTAPGLAYPSNRYSPLRNSLVHAGARDGEIVKCCGS